MAGRKSSSLQSLTKEKSTRNSKTSTSEKFGLLRFFRQKRNYGDWHKKTQKLTILQQRKLNTKAEKKGRRKYPNNIK